MNLYWAKVKDTAVIPTKRPEDAGYDLYPCFEEPYLEIGPFETKLVPLGVASAFDSDYVLFLKERGSTGVRGLSLRAGVMDSGYRGEYVAPITNLNHKALRIIKKESLPAFGTDENILYYPYEKAICQGVLLQMPAVESTEVSLQDLLEMKSQRSDGKLGSSGK